EPYPVSVAPMMAVTDRHCRFLHRTLSKHTLLYTEMVSTGAILHGDRSRWLTFSPEERPLVLQLGGDDPTALAECARIAEEHGFDEVNLNVGCPSPRVQTGNFGACLMSEPSRVAAAVDAMRHAVSVPVTVKHRIGIDDLDKYEDMANFVGVVAASGCDRFTVHARKAWLSGLSPRENRTIPPLRYADVHRLKRDFPDEIIEINGGFTSLEQVEEQLELVDGVMIGRAADSDPYLLAQVDSRFFGSERTILSRHEVVEAMFPYIDHMLTRGERLYRIVRHMLNLFAGQRGSRAWKRYLSEEAHRPGADIDVVRAALERVPRP
ncbi:MAG TPA: tRNA dihydrouridine(20/20a) synthase DusA, partial [Deltaproteobacteria bacterium]|nr:tRNA dihydrouridine(20/20a) synthase DusA [Deltaproteobacteria bacterium]